MTDFVTVTKDQFFAAIGPMDVHPRSEKNQSVWVNQQNRAIVGTSTPGYLCVGEVSYKLDPKLVS